MGKVMSDDYHHQNEDSSLGDSKYLPQLCVFGKQGSVSKGNTKDPHSQNIPHRIKSGLKLVRFREPHVLVQFWSPQLVGKHQLLTTINQPFGLGVNDERLHSYRQDSECKTYVVEKVNEEEDRSPVVRVFKRGLPELTFDIANYSSTYFSQKEFAIHCNFHGYLALPVFNSTLCVGVLELLMSSSKYTSFAHEVQQVHNAMKTVDLITPQALDRPYSNVQYKDGQNPMKIIHTILKIVCETHKLPLAQTWAISPLSSFASHYDTRCREKVFMSTTCLPFHVQDLKMWDFWEACKKRHVDTSRGYIGKALLSKGLSFCGDVTKLSYEDYPLVHNARMSRLTSCFAVFVHNNVEPNSDDYVLEFFLPDTKCVPNVVETLKQEFKVARGFELGDTSVIQVVGPPTVKMVNGSDTASTSISCVDDNFMFPMGSSDPESISSMTTACDTWMVIVTFYNSVIQFPFSISMPLSDLKSEVANIFDLHGKDFRLMYKDKDNDWISICVDADLEMALKTSVNNNTINLICEYR